VADRAFVDTNVWIYAHDERAGLKRDRARALLQELVSGGLAVVSTQILQEFFDAATRKLRISAEGARRRVETMARNEVVLIRPELVLGAIDLHRLHKISLWDALVLRSAAAAGCARILSEDLNHGQVIDGVPIENPFAGG
jgi:predicted nucleic acid-binding protein